MTSSTERVVSAFPATGPEGVDFKALVDDEEYWRNTGSILHPDAEIRFLTPDGGFVGPLAGPFRGPKGFREGWREWMRAWDAVSARVDETLESEDGRLVLLLVTLNATIAGSGTVVDQPAAALYELRDDRIVAIDHFLDQDQARRAFEER